MALLDKTGLLLWRRWLAGGSRGRTLEVGAGTGRNLPLLTKRLPVVAVEPDLRLLARARRRASGAALVAGRAEVLPFSRGSFDTVVSSLVFCSVSDPERGLAEVARVLRPSGRLRMIEHVRSARPWLGRLQDLLQPCWTVISGGCHPNRDTEEAVRRAGFTIGSRGRRARNSMRRFEARRAIEPAHGSGPA
jgi:ubiquinone/menaquinone biosynthesis C-methylase UbiE